jgi:hypothetical protein
MLAGYRDGNIELIAAGSESAGRTIPFEHVPDSEVVRLELGPQSTVIAGYADGTLGMWDIVDGSRLGFTHVHGPVTMLTLVGQHIDAASDLGRATRWDLTSFYQDHCEVLRQVWSQVPVVWLNGQPQLQPPPAEHRCATAE